MKLTLGHEVSLQGTCAELLISHSLLHYGIHVLKPLGNYTPYDLITDYNGNLKKLQVKSHVVTKQRTPYISLKRANKREFDILVVVLYQEGNITETYFIPKKFLLNKKQISFPKRKNTWLKYLNSMQIFTH